MIFDEIEDIFQRIDEATEDIDVYSDSNSDNSDALGDNIDDLDTETSIFDENGTNPKIYYKSVLDDENKKYTAYHKAKKYLEDNGIKISTITLNCSLGSKINSKHFAKYADLSEDGILDIKYKEGNNIIHRTILYLCGEITKKKIFNNQITVLMVPSNNKERKHMNIKIFHNGTLQVTGCKDMEDFKSVSTKLISILKKEKKIKNDKNVTSYIKYVEDFDSLCVSNISIRLINSNFKINYKIDRDYLSYILEKYHSKHTTDTDIGYVEHKPKSQNGHSCVNIKCAHTTGKKTSIFVFHPGSIIITGAKNLNNIIDSHKFIMKILKKYEEDIKVTDLITVKKDVLKHIKMYKLDQNKRKREREHERKHEHEHEIESDRLIMNQ
jgi:TATA-box binding protein (TBP) (component of TFIID and TFIIIB)